MTTIFEAASPTPDNGKMASPASSIGWVAGHLRQSV